MTLKRANINAQTNTAKLGMSVLSKLGIPGASKPVLTGSKRNPPNNDQIIAFRADII